MYPTLHHLFKDLFGLDWAFLKNVNSFGLIIVIAILLGVYFFRKEIIRKESLGYFDDYNKKISANQFKPHQQILPIVLISLVFGLFGAKLFTWIENPKHFWHFFSDPFSGLTVYGGVLFALASSYIYLRVKKLPVIHFLDGASPSLMLTYGIGRLGCHVSGDGDWGIVNTAAKPDWLSIFPDWLWSYNYPNNVNNEGVLIQNCPYDDYCYQLASPVYPTPLYEILMCVLLFGILWYLRKKLKTIGMLFFIYLVFNGIERFLIEIIRVNDTYSIFGLDLSQAQIISLFFIIIGAGGIFYLRIKASKRNST